MKEAELCTLEAITMHQLLFCVLHFPQQQYGIYVVRNYVAPVLFWEGGNAVCRVIGV